MRQEVERKTDMPKGLAGVSSSYRRDVRYTYVGTTDVSSLSLLSVQ